MPLATATPNSKQHTHATTRRRREERVFPESPMLPRRSVLLSTKQIPGPGTQPTLMWAIPGPTPKTRARLRAHTPFSPTRAASPSPRRLLTSLTVVTHCVVSIEKGKATTFSRAILRDQNPIKSLSTSNKGARKFALISGVLFYGRAINAHKAAYFYVYSGHICATQCTAIPVL